MVERSIIDRDARIFVGLGVLVPIAACFALLRGGIAPFVYTVVGGIVVLLVAFVIGFARFSSGVVQDPTGHRLRRSELPVGAAGDDDAEALDSLGFVADGCWAFSAHDGTVLSGPYLMFHHAQEPEALWTGSAGVTCATALADGRWLCTSSTGALRHPKVVGQTADDRNVDVVVGVHREARGILEREGLSAAEDSVDAVAAFHAAQQRELDLVRDRSALGRLWALWRGAAQGPLSPSELAEAAHQ